MAQTGFSPIQTYSSSTPGNTPTAGNLLNNTVGSELAINIADGKLFYKDSGNAVQVIAWKTTPTTAGGTGLTSYTAGDLPYYASGAAFTKLGIGTSGYFMTSSGSAPQWTDPTTISVTSISFGTTGLTPSTATKGAVTVAGTLSVTNGGTGLATLTSTYIPYGNGTSAFNSSANLTFDGNNLYVSGRFSQGVAPYSWGSNYISDDLGYGAIANNNSANNFHITTNAYNDNTNWKYKFTNGSLRYTLQNDQHEWYYAASGSAGTNITYTQVMVLASSGQLYVTGAVQTNGLVSHAGTGGAYGSNKFNFQWTGNPILWVDGTNIGQIATVSDYRLKENVVAQQNTALERIMKLQPVEFNRKAIGIFSGSTNIEEGFIADQLQAIIPSAVYGEKDAITENGSIQPQSLNWSPVVSVLTKALQELNNKFEAYVASHP